MIGLLCLSLSAQRTLEKNLDHKGQDIEVDLRFASSIEVATWDGATVYFKADITTRDGKFLDLYKLKVVQNERVIEIKSKPEELFKAIQREFHGNRSDQGVHMNAEDYDFKYVLYVPKNAKFKVSSINGDLRAEIIEGDFTAELINGDIEIKKYAGDMDLETINGEIDLVLGDSNLQAETIHGNIYADEGLELRVTDRIVGQRVEGRFKRATHQLKLNTINGNMYLRPMTDR